MPVIACHRRSQQAFGIGQVIRLLGKQVFRVEHFVKGCLACAVRLDLLVSRVATPGLPATQGQGSQRRMCRRMIRNQSQSLNIGLYGLIKITCLTQCAGLGKQCISFFKGLIFEF